MTLNTPFSHGRSLAGASGLPLNLCSQHRPVPPGAQACSLPSQGQLHLLSREMTDCNTTRTSVTLYRDGVHDDPGGRLPCSSTFQLEKKNPLVGNRNVKKREEHADLGRLRMQTLP